MHFTTIIYVRHPNPQHTSSSILSPIVFLRNYNTLIITCYNTLMHFNSPSPFLLRCSVELNLSQLVPRMMRPNYISRLQHTLHERSPTLPTTRLNLTISSALHYLLPQHSFLFFLLYIYMYVYVFLWSATSLLVVSGCYWCV